MLEAGREAQPVVEHPLLADRERHRAAHAMGSGAAVNVAAAGRQLREVSLALRQRARVRGEGAAERVGQHAQRTSLGGGIEGPKELLRVS